MMEIDPVYWYRSVEPKVDSWVFWCLHHTVHPGHMTLGNKPPLIIHTSIIHWRVSDMHSEHQSTSKWMSTYIYIFRHRMCPKSNYPLTGACRPQLRDHRASQGLDVSTSQTHSVPGHFVYIVFLCKKSKTPSQLTTALMHLNAYYFWFSGHNRNFIASHWDHFWRDIPM